MYVHLPPSRSSVVAAAVRSAILIRSLSPKHTTQHIPAASSAADACAVCLGMYATRIRPDVAAATAGCLFCAVRRFYEGPLTRSRLFFIGVGRLMTVNMYTQ